MLYFVFKISYSLNLSIKNLQLKLELIKTVEISFLLYEIVSPTKGFKIVINLSNVIINKSSNCIPGISNLPVLNILT